MTLEAQLDYLLDHIVNIEEHDSLSALACTVHTKMVGRVANWIKQNRLGGCNISLVQSFELINNRMGEYKVDMTFTRRGTDGQYTFSLKSQVKKEAILKAFINQCRIYAQPLCNDLRKPDDILAHLSDRLNNPETGDAGVRYFVDYRDVQNMLVQFQVRKEFEMLLAGKAHEQAKGWTWL